LQKASDLSRIKNTSKGVDNLGKQVYVPKSQYEKVGIHLDGLGENIASADKSVPDRDRNEETFSGNKMAGSENMPVLEPITLVKEKKKRKRKRMRLTMKVINMLISLFIILNFFFH